MEFKIRYYCCFAAGIAAEIPQQALGMLWCEELQRIARLQIFAPGHKRPDEKSGCKICKPPLKLYFKFFYGLLGL